MTTGVGLVPMAIGLGGYSEVWGPLATVRVWGLAASSILTLFLIPATRKNPITLNLGCVLIYVGVYLEKGMGLVIPGLTPDTLGEVYEYFPSRVEIAVSVGIFSIGFLLFTLMVKVATPIILGEFRSEELRS